MRAKYANKPTQLASILENTYQFHDHIRNCKLYEDVVFKRDCVETGKKRNFKHQGNEEPSSSRKRAKSNGKPAPEAPKLKKGEVGKLNKKLEAVASKRLMCLDYLEKSSKYQDMAPAYAGSDRGLHPAGRLARGCGLRPCAAWLSLSFVCFFVC